MNLSHLRVKLLHISFLYMRHRILFIYIVFFCFYLQVFSDWGASIDVLVPALRIYHFNLFLITVSTGGLKQLFFFRIYEYLYAGFVHPDIFILFNDPFSGLSEFPSSLSFLYFSLHNSFPIYTSSNIRFWFALAWKVAPIFKLWSRRLRLQNSGDIFTRLGRLSLPERKKHEMFWVRRFYIECCWNRPQNPISKTTFGFQYTLINIYIDNISMKL